MCTHISVILRCRRLHCSVVQHLCADEKLVPCCIWIAAVPSLRNWKQKEKSSSQVGLESMTLWVLSKINRITHVRVGTRVVVDNSSCVFNRITDFGMRCPLEENVSSGLTRRCLKTLENRVSFWFLMLLYFCQRQPRHLRTMNEYINNRVYLVGGSGAANNDPDIALECFSWSSSSQCSGEGQRQLCDNAGKGGGTATANHTIAAAPSATIAPVSSSTGPVAGPALVCMPASQEGDVPAARIGHAAVALTTSPTSSGRPSILVFGGEASNPGDPLYPKFADVYEATPKARSGDLVWRALTPPRVPTPRKSTSIDTEPHIAHDVPAPVAFHAFCAASVCGAGDGDGSSGTERALLIHGGMNQSSELLADLWAFFPGRLSSTASSGGGATREGGDGASVNSSYDGATTGWNRLQPQGEG